MQEAISEGGNLDEVQQESCGWDRGSWLRNPTRLTTVHD